MIRDCLVPALKREFAGWDIAFDTPPNPIATFPASQGAAGRVFVHDDGDEVTIHIEKITHGHFNPYDETLSDEERARIITDDVIGFLKALFSDRVLLNVSDGHKSSGWARLDLTDKPVKLKESTRYFLWSGAYEPPK